MPKELLQELTGEPLTYRCIGCGKVYSEIYLNPATRDGEGGDLVELIKMKLGEIK
ncbi:hypothetical protein HYT25_05040 [Candidatus Pacearchaeota archaeon]|nr:hypothetical protein [Candidatus Pacearchaeota archaeon]